MSETDTISVDAAESFGEALATDFSGGMADDQREPFQFTPEMRRQMRGGSVYMDVKWRILWFRHENPGGGLMTELVELNDKRAVFKCTATKDPNNGGGSASGFGSETQADFNDFIEKAETKARGRALEGLGYGTSAMLAEDEGALADAPVAAPRSANAQRLSHGSGPDRATPGQRNPPPENVAQRPAQPRESASQPPPTDAQPAAPEPPLLSERPLPEKERATPGKVGELARLMQDNGEDMLTVPIAYLSRQTVNDAITRLKNGGRSALDGLWVRMSKDAEHAERNREFCGDVLLTYSSPSDQQAHFANIVAERVAWKHVSPNSWYFLLWATKQVHTPETEAITSNRLARLAEAVPADALLDKVVDVAKSVLSTGENDPVMERIFMAYERFNAPEADANA